MQTPTLLAYLANGARARIVRKGLFTGEYVLFGDYMTVSQFLYEVGAILGYAYRGRITSLVSLYCQPGQENDLIAHMSQSIASKLAEIGHEPKDFTELYFIPEATRLMRVLRNAGLTKLSDWSDFPKLAKHKIRATDIWSQLQFAVAQGIAFDYSRPELAEKLFTYEDDPQS